MDKLSKKERISELLMCELTRSSYSKNELDGAILDIIKPELTNIPMFAPDHLRRAMIEFGYMIRDPYTDIFSKKVGFSNLIERHELAQEKINKYINKVPNNKIKCEYCEYESKPVAMLNHYFKKHSHLDYLNALKNEFASIYYNC